MSQYPNDSVPAKKNGLSGRAIGGLIIAALVIVFIVINRAETEVNFIVTTVTMSLWMALTIAAVGGLIAGFLIGRKRYKP